MPSFREEFNFEQRLAESQKIRDKYADKIPVIVELNEKYGWFTKTEKLPELGKKKYLVPGDLKFGQFFQVIRKRIKLDPEKAMFMFVGERGEIPPTGETMSELYETHKDEDNFIYISLTGESTYGF